MASNCKFWSDSRDLREVCKSVFVGRVQLRTKYISDTDNGDAGKAAISFSSVSGGASSSRALCGLIVAPESAPPGPSAYGLKVVSHIPGVAVAVAVHVGTGT